MASLPVDIQIRQALQKLKKESAQLTIECQLKKHLTIIKDLIESGISITTIADRLSQAGITGNIKDIIAAINALVGTETSIDADINWYIVTGDPDSLSPLIDSINLHGAGMHHVVIRNEKFPKSKLSFPRELQELLAEYDIPTINLPLIHSRAQDYVLANQLPYEDAALLDDNAAGYSALDQHALKHILHKCYSSIDSTGIFQVAPSSTK